MLQFTLERNGVVCDTAVDGLEALELFSEREYALVILDQYMPGMNGAQVAKRIRSQNRGVPLIAITSDDSQVPALNAAGFNRVFLKPLRGQDYIAAIMSYL